MATIHEYFHSIWAAGPRLIYCAALDLSVYIVTANGFFSRGHFGELIETENITKDFDYDSDGIKFVDISGCSGWEKSENLPDV